MTPCKSASSNSLILWRVLALFCLPERPDNGRSFFSSSSSSFSFSFVFFLFFFFFARLSGIQAEIAATDRTADEALQIAVDTCDLDAVKEAIVKGADITAANEADQSYLQSIWVHAEVNEDSESTSEKSAKCEKVFAYLVQQPGLDVDRRDQTNEATALVTVLRLPWATSKSYVLDSAVKELLNRKANPNIPDKGWNYPLGLLLASKSIASSQRLQLLDALLAAKALPNLRDGEGRGALHVTLEYWRPFEEMARVGNLDVTIKKLLTAGADINMIDLAQKTPLNVAASFSTPGPSVVKLLLTEGADVNLADADDHTPLHTACLEANPGIVQLLLLNDPKPLINAQTQDGRTPLWFVAEGNYSLFASERTAVKLLKAGAEVDLADKDGNAPIHRAALYLKKAMVKVLLKAGSKVDLVNKEGQTALHMAAMLNGLKDEGLTELLVVYKFDINLRDKAGRTPLHVLLKPSQIKMEMRHVQMIERLLNLGADADIADDHGKTALHYIAKHWTKKVKRPKRRLQMSKFQTNEKMKELEALTILLEQRLKVNAQDLDGNTPLHTLLKGNVKSKIYEATKFLITAGSNVHLRNSGGRTPLAIAARSGLQGEVTLLLQKDSDPNAADSNGQVPLHLANSPDCVRILLDAGSQINRKDKAGDTPLMENIIMDRLENVQLLLARGADKSIANKYSETAYDLADRSRLWRAAEIKRWVSKAGWTQLHYATMFCLNDAVRAALASDPHLYPKRTKDTKMTARQMAFNNKENCAIVYKTLTEFQAASPFENEEDPEDMEAKARRRRAKRLLQERRRILDAADKKTGRIVLLLAIGSMAVETFFLHYKYLCMQSEISRFAPGLMLAVGSLVVTQTTIMRSSSVSSLGYIGFVVGLIFLAIAFRARKGSKLEVSLQRWKRRDLWAVGVTVLTISMSACIFLREVYGPEGDMVGAVAVCLVTAGALIGLCFRGQWAKILHWSLHLVGAMVLEAMVFIDFGRTSSARPASTFLVTALLVECFVDHAGHFGKEREHALKLQQRDLQIQHRATMAAMAANKSHMTVDIEMSTTARALESSTEDET